ncbi:TPA: hypothetical protein N0F65_002266 [Lagenidium giganteum]|uniref:Ankyrin n=1 Tax=Lagenidium giganteum TaxID=4803 RepID=A0AAV2YR01_9STRA|nr:TPA: hypothetical protein N0F65_002266 [Lagenidium giganteum]
MLARGTSPNGAVLWNRTTALHLASRAGYADVVMLLIEHGADPNVIDHLHLTPLLGAISNGHEEVVRMLLGAGADVNYRSPAGVSAVHTAVASRSLPILRVLIEHSAIVNTANPLSGATPLHIAAENGSFELCELLLEFGSNVHERNARGLDAFMLATLRGHMAVADLCRRHMCRGPSFPRGLDDYELSPPSRLSDLASAAAEGQHVEIIATDGHSYAIL